MDVAIFVPETESRRSTELARKVCGRCPEVDACRFFAVPIPGLRGVWGATTSRDRGRLRNLGGGAAMSDQVLDDVPEPSAPELDALEAEELDDVETSAESTARGPVPACAVCRQPLEPERVRRLAVTCSRQSCQAQHKRNLDQARKLRDKAKSNGHLEPERAPAVAATPVAVALSADAYHANGRGNHASNGWGQAENPQVPLEAVSAWLAALPPAVTAVELGTGWRLARTGA